MVGHREGSMSKEFKRVIPGAAFLGAVTIASIGVIGDITGALAGGAGTFMGLHIVQTYMAMGMMVSCFSRSQHRITNLCVGVGLRRNARSGGHDGYPVSDAVCLKSSR